MMLGKVDAAGHSLVEDPHDAEVIVVNTCGFLSAAIEESIDTILEMAEHKKSGRCEKLVVSGCLPQRFPKELADEIPEIDHILGSGDHQAIDSVVVDTKRKSLPIVTVSETPAYLQEHNTPRLLTGATHTAYLKIAEGCDRPCGFCIIPKLRGPQRSRSVEDIVAEATALAASGTVELNLVAQDLTRYGSDRSDGASLESLMRRLAVVDQARWLRLHYTYPSAFTDGLISAIAEESTICNYVDVPVQHIDDGVLKLMRRGHGSRAIRDLVERLRSRVDGVYLRTTLIVGHPGEDADAFARLRDFVQEAQFDHLGVFAYSSERGTASAVLPGQVDPQVAEERCAEIMSLQREISRQKLQKLRGTRIEVLVDGISDESDFLLQGRHAGQALDIDGVVYLANCSSKPGDFVLVEVTDSADHDLVAEPV